MFKVIVGSGIAGLFTGMIFDHLKKKYGLDVEYEILEANDETGVGGRLHSYYFNSQRKGRGIMSTTISGPCITLTRM